MDELSSAFGIKVDFTFCCSSLTPAVSTVCQTMRGYDDAQVRVIFRHFIDMPSAVVIPDF
jgi:hypothetical protein